MGQKSEKKIEERGQVWGLQGVMGEAGGKDGEGQGTDGARSAFSQRVGPEASTTEHGFPENHQPPHFGANSSRRHGGVFKLSLPPLEGPLPLLLLHLSIWFLVEESEGADPERQSSLLKSFLGLREPKALIEQL